MARTKRKIELASSSDPRYILGMGLKGKEVLAEPGTEEATRDYLLSRGSEIDRALVDACKAHNAQALKIAYTLMGKIKEEGSKVKVSIDGSDIAREFIAAKEYLGKAGMGTVPVESGVLHPDIRKVTGQDKDQDDTVRPVGLPEGAITKLSRLPADSDIKGTAIRD